MLGRQPFGSAAKIAAGLEEVEILAAHSILPKIAYDKDI
jgi:hypothetical protein